MSTVKERLIDYLRKELTKLSNKQLDRVKELIDSFEEGGPEDVKDDNKESD